MELTQAKIFKDGKWEDIDFKDLKKGDRFQLVNPDGSYHKDDNGKTDWVATSDAYLNKNGIYEILVA